MTARRQEAVRRQDRTRGRFRDVRSAQCPSRALAALLATCLLGALWAGPAEARVSDRDMARSLRIAYDYWASMTDRVNRARYNCERGNARARWHRDLGSAMATAKLGGCVDPVPRVNLEGPTIRRLGDAHTCGVITHEFGHLLGYLHNKTRGSIMYSSTTGTRSGPDVARRATWDKVYRNAYCGRL